MLLHIGLIGWSQGSFDIRQENSISVFDSLGEGQLKIDVFGSAHGKFL